MSSKIYRYCYYYLQLVELASQGSLVQPYHVGSRKAKSLALVIPAQLVKEYKITSSTVFALIREENPRRITLQTINEVNEAKKKKTTPAGESLAASNQKVLSSGVQLVTTIPT